MEGHEGAEVKIGDDVPIHDDERLLEVLDRKQGSGGSQGLVLTVVLE